MLGWIRHKPSGVLLQINGPGGTPPGAFALLHANGNLGPHIHRW